MENQQLPPWLLMNQNRRQPLKFAAPIDVSLENPNQGMSLSDANRIVEQQRQASSMGLAPIGQVQSVGTASMRSPEDDALIRDLANSYGEQTKLQQEAIRQAEEQLAAARAKPQQMDLSPLIALAEGWSQKPIGLLRAYQAPENNQKTVQALQEAVLKARGGAAEISRMRAKDVAQLSQQDRQMKINEELKRLTIGAMQQEKGTKGDTKALDREISLTDKIAKSDEAKAIRGAVQMNNAVNNYIETIKKHQGNILNKNARAEIANAYESTIMAFKAAEELGALQKEDVVRAQSKLPDVASFFTAAQRFGGLAPDVSQSIEVIRKIPQEYGNRGKIALERLKTGYGKFGGQDILSQYESELSSSMQGDNSRKQMLEMEMRRRMQGGSK